MKNAKSTCTSEDTILYTKDVACRAFYNLMMDLANKQSMVSSDEIIRVSKILELNEYVGED